jgi:hypothetical protein
MTTHNIDELARAEANVERTRERVANSVVALRDEVVKKTDWRHWVAHRPGRVLGAAFLVGYWLGNRR